LVALSSCGKGVDYATETGKRLFPFQSVPLSRLVLTPIEPGKLKLKDADSIRVYAYAVKVTPRYTARGYLFEGPKDLREKGGNAILFGHWLGGTQNVDSSEREFFAEAASFARDGNVCVIPSGHHPWMESSTGTADDIPLVIAQVNDYRIGLDILYSRFGKEPAKAMVISHDYGAMFAILTAAADSRVGAAVIMAPVPYFYYWSRILRSIPEGPVLEAYKAAMLPYEPISLVGGLSIPILFQYAEPDQFVNRIDGTILVDAAIKSPKEARWYKGTHNLTRYPQITAERREWVEGQFALWNADRGEER
jgi:pimeloyl-ACP methyl ester carboxylesterase